MTLNVSAMRKALIHLQKMYQRVAKVKPPRTPVPVSTATSDSGDIAAACKSLRGVIKEFSNIDTRMSAGELQNAVHMAEKRLSDVIMGSRSASKDVQDAVQEVMATNNKLQGMKMFTSYSDNFKQQAGQFRSKYGQLVRTMSQEGGIQFGSGKMSKMNAEMETSYQRTVELLNDVSRFGLDTDKELTEAEKAMALNIEMNLNKELQMLDGLVSESRKALDISNNLGRAAETVGPEWMRDGKKFLGEMQHIKDQLRRGDVLGAAGTTQKMQAAGAPPPGMKEMDKAAAGMSKSLGALVVVDMLVKAVKQVVGYFVGVNNAGAEFNEELTKTHGLVSQGIPITVDINTDTIDDNFHKYQRIVMEYGSKSGTFVNPKEIMAITAAFESQGVKLKDVAGDTEKFNATMRDVLGYSARLGMTTTEVAGVMADFKQNVNMSAEAMSHTLDSLVKSSDETGMPGRMLLETIRSANFDYSMWGEGMLFAIEMQKKSLQGGKGLAVGNKALQTAFDLINKTSATVYMRLMDKLPSIKFNELIANDLDFANKKLNLAVTPDEKTKWNDTIEQLEQLKKIDPALAKKRYFSEDGPGSIAGKGNVLKESLLVQFGDALKKAKANGGFVDSTTRSQIEAMLDRTGESEADWLALLKSFDIMAATDFTSVLQAAAASADDVVKQQKLRDKLNKEMAPHIKTKAEIMESMWNRWMTKIIAASDVFIGYLKKLVILKWMGAAVGVDTGDEGDESKKAEAESNLMQAALKVSQMDASTPEGKKARDKALDELRNQIGAANAAGVDISKIADKFEETGKAPDVVKRLREAGSGGFAPGGSAALSPKWKKMIENVNPSDAARIIKMIEVAAGKTGVAADILAGTMLGETTLGTDKKDSKTGAHGIMQIEPDTARQIANVTGMSYDKIMNDDQTAIIASGEYRKWQYKQLIESLTPGIKKWNKPDQEKAMYAAYNSGHQGFANQYNAATKKLGHEPTSYKEMKDTGSVYKETRGYIDKIADALGKNGAGGNAPPATPPATPPAAKPPTQAPVKTPDPAPAVAAQPSSAGQKSASQGGRGGTKTNTAVHKRTTNITGDVRGNKAIGDSINDKVRAYK